jgi:cell division protein ZapA (FtsZ GTPase activity inhibitor)
MQKNLKISIFGKNYLVSTDENSEEVTEAARVVETLMKDKAERTPLRGEGQLAVIVALELATDLARKMQLLKQWEARVEALNRAVEVPR